MQLIEQTEESLIDYTCTQVANFFPDGKHAILRNQVRLHIKEALNRLEYCINNIRMWTPNQFHYLHSSQYCLYLYYLANTIWRNTQDRDTGTRLFLLNKALNGIDLFYEIEMPDIFFIGHSVGIVLAKASYGNRLALYQNVTVGKNHGIAPVIGEGVILYPGTTIIGRSHVANGTIVSQGTGIVNRDTPGNCVVYAGERGNLTFKPAKRAMLYDIFRV
jgi:serine O-acetyltransferase